MNPAQLALRSLLYGRPRLRLAVSMVALCLAALDLFAARLSSEGAQLEYQAVVGERLGHLSIARPREAGSPVHAALEPDETRRIKQLAESVQGVALVVPQMNIVGVASTGNAVTLTGVTPHLPPLPVNAQVVDIFSTAEFSPNARSLLMPIEMAQALLDTGRTERLIVFLADPQALDRQRAALVRALQGAGLATEVRSWQELSATYVGAQRASDIEFTSAAVVALGLIGMVVTATLTINAFERRRELATLRALGMRRWAVFLMLVIEGCWISTIGALCGLVLSGLIAWVVNRTLAGPATLQRAPALLEFQPERVLLALGATLAVTVLVAIAPAWRAARADVAAGLGADVGAGDHGR